MLPVGHNQSVNQTLFSRDGKWVATVSDDQTIKVWERHSQRLLYTLTGHQAEVDLAAFSSSGTKLLTGSRDQTARLWDLETGRLLFTFQHAGRISQLAFSPDDQYILVLAWKEMKAVIRRVSDGMELMNCMQETDSTDTRSWTVYYRNQTRRFAAPPDQVEFSRDSRRVYLSSYKGIREWSLPETGEARSWSLPDNDRQSLAIHTGKKLMAAGDRKDRIGIWNWETNTWKEIYAPGKKFRMASFSPDGTRLLTGAEDGTVQLWDAATGRILYFLKGHQHELLQVKFITDSICFSEARAEPVQWYDGRGNLIGQANGIAVTASEDGRFLGLSAGTKGIIYPVNPQTAPVSLDTKGQVPQGFYFAKDLSFGGINYENSGYVYADWAANELGVPERNSEKPSTITGISQDEDCYYLRNGDRLFRVVRAGSRKSLLADSITQCIISADGRYLSYIRNGAGYLLDANTAAKIRMEKRSRYLASISFSPRNHWIFQVADSVYVMEPLTGTLKGVVQIRNRFNLSADAKTYYTGSSLSSAIGIYSFPDSKPLRLIEAPDIISTVDMDPAGKKLVTTSWNGQALVWSYPEGQVLFRLQDSTLHFAGARFSPDGKYIVTAARDPVIRVWYAHNGRLAYSIKGHSGQIRSASFSGDGKKIIAIANDLALGIWESRPGGNGQMYYQINGEVVRVNRDGYYAGAPEAVKSFYFRKGMQTIGMDQLDARYNRPDLILEETIRMMGLKDTLLLASYRKALEKRWKKLGIDHNRFTESYGLPAAEILNRDKISFEQKDNRLTLHLRAADSLYTLDRFNIWVNESPVFGQQGLQIGERNLRSLDTSIQIRLSAGMNRIECGVRNSIGTENYRFPLEVNYQPPTPEMEMTRFIGIGIDRFSENDHDLQYSVEDIRELALALKARYPGRILIDTLFNEDVTAENVKRLRTGLLKSTVNDKVVIAYSGHGLLSRDFDYYLSTYSVNFEKPEINGLPYDELESLLDSIPARRKLLLIDACHSGEVDKEEMARMKAAADTLKRQGIKGGKPSYTGKTILGMQNSFELMQNLFVNLGRSTGATVIAAAAGTQFAQERGDLKNGVFTYCILELLQNQPSVKISELKESVGERVVQLTSGLQKPTSRSAPILSDWEL